MEAILALATVRKSLQFQRSPNRKPSRSDFETATDKESTECHKENVNTSTNSDFDHAIIVDFEVKVSSIIEIVDDHKVWNVEQHTMDDLELLRQHKISRTNSKPGNRVIGKTNEPGCEGEKCPKDLGFDKDPRQNQLHASRNPNFRKPTPNRSRSFKTKKELDAGCRISKKETFRLKNPTTPPQNLHRRQTFTARDQIQPVQTGSNQFTPSANQITNRTTTTLQSTNKQNLQLLICVDSNKKRLRWKRVYTLSGTGRSFAGRLHELHNLVCTDGGRVGRLRRILINVGYTDVEDKSANQVLSELKRLVGSVRSRNEEVVVHICEISPRKMKDTVVQQCNNMIHHTLGSMQGVFVMRPLDVPGGGGPQIS